MDQDNELLKVQEIISNAALSLKSIEVKKDIPIEVDVGNLVAVDTNEIDKNTFRNTSEENEYLKELARDGIQVIINKVWDLPSEVRDNFIFGVLPKPTLRLPREKPVPKPKPLTRWEQFAKEKGIKKKKKGNLAWDDVLKKWVPRFGYRKAEAEKEKNWMVEVPGNADPNEDMFGKRAEAKRERIAKNEYQRLRNIAKAKKIKVPNVGVTSVNMKSKDEMSTALTQTRFATASLGKFQKPLPNEGPLRESMRGKKRKLPANETTADGIKNEATKSLKILGNLKKKELNYEMAVNKQIREENIEMQQKGKKRPKSGRRSKHGKKKIGKSEHKFLSRSFSKAKGGKGKGKAKGSKMSTAGKRGGKAKKKGKR